MKLTIQLLLFLGLSIPVILVSWRSFRRWATHGIFRFISWECILWLFLSQIPVWFHQVLTWNQLISWVLLFGSIYPALAGPVALKKGRKGYHRRDRTLYEFERTTELVTSGIYRYIRHPMYASLLYLTWGIFFKNPDWSLLIISLISSVSLYLTARMEEQENIRFFGESYLEYMKKTTRLIPFVF